MTATSSSCTASACAGCAPPSIDCGNAGTLARLVTGVLAFQDGDVHAHRRRVAVGAPDGTRRRCRCSAWARRSRRPTGTCPLTIDRRRAARDRVHAAGRERAGEVGDAARRARRAGRTTVRRAGADARPHRADAPRRRARGVTIRPATVSIDPAESLTLGTVDVPGDFSSAAPFIVAATLLPESRITIHDVSLNPRRTGLLDVLERMGGRVGSHASPLRRGAGRRHRDPPRGAHCDDDRSRTRCR